MFQCLFSAPFLCHCNVKSLYNGRNRNTMQNWEYISSMSCLIQNVISIKGGHGGGGHGGGGGGHGGGGHGGGHSSAPVKIIKVKMNVRKNGSRVQCINLKLTIFRLQLIDGGSSGGHGGGGGGWQSGKKNRSFESNCTQMHTHQSNAVIVHQSLSSFRFRMCNVHFGCWCKLL